LLMLDLQVITLLTPCAGRKSSHHQRTHSRKAIQALV
jgi:hypothetical protein